MKARKKNSNDEWKEIKYVQLEDSDILYKAEVMEFNAPLSESELYEQMGLESPLQDYWQEVRERAAIAAMQGLLANPQLVYNNSEEKIIFTARAIRYADELVEKLKKK